MAKKVSTKTVDDFDGSDAFHVRELAVDGERVELDLSNENNARFDDAMKEFLAAGRAIGKYRPLSKIKVGVPKAALRARNSAQDLEAARAFGRANGCRAIPNRGKVEEVVLSAYRTNNTELLQQSKYWAGGK